MAESPAAQPPEPGSNGRYVLIPRAAALSEYPTGMNARSYWEAPDAYRLWTMTFQVEGPTVV